MTRFKMAAYLLVLVVLLSGCVNNKWRKDEATAFYTAQKELATTRKPLFELRAQPGQTIQLSGVESLTVNDPREATIAPLPQTESPAWRILDRALGIAGNAYMTKTLADGVVDIVATAASNAGDHSITNTAITGSYNTQGDTLTGSIGGSVNGDGSGIGTTYTSRDTTVSGSRNAVGTQAGRDVAIGDGSQSPVTIDDHSTRGDICDGEQCQSKPVAAPAKRVAPKRKGSR